MAQIDFIVVISRWLHIIAAMTAIGGAAFALIALIPAVKTKLEESFQEEFMQAVRKKWFMVVNLCVAFY